MTIRSRIQGTSLVLTVPASFNVPNNTEFEPKKLPDGTIQFTPVKDELLQSSESTIGFWDNPEDEIWDNV